VLNFLLPQLVFEAYYSGICARINRLIVGFASGIRARINGSESFILSFYQLLFGEYSAASKFGRCSKENGGNESKFSNVMKRKLEYQLFFV
jgi:hypothetical protein